MDTSSGKSVDIAGAVLSDPALRNSNRIDEFLKRNHPVLHRLRTFPEGGSFEEFISRWFPRGLFAADAFAERLHAVFGKAGPSLSGLRLLFRRMAGIKGIEGAPSGPRYLRWRTAKACDHAALPVRGLLNGPYILDHCSSVGHFHPLIRLAHLEARIISCDQLLITQDGCKAFLSPGRECSVLSTGRKPEAAVFRRCNQ